MHENVSQLTEKQKRFYDSLRMLIERRGESPTVAELVRLMKFSSPRAVTQYLESLERKGLIERRRYERRGIRLLEGEGNGGKTVNIPVIASAGCDNVNVFAQRNLGDYVCVSMGLLQGRDKNRVVCVKAIGDSMVDAGIKEGDYVLTEVTEDITQNDLVVAIIDSFAVIKKIDFAQNAIVLHPVSSNPEYKPIILRRDFRIFGKVIDIIRMRPKDDIEIVPLYVNPEEPKIEYSF